MWQLDLWGLKKEKNLFLSVMILNFSKLGVGRKSAGMTALGVGWKRLTPLPELKTPLAHALILSP